MFSAEWCYDNFLQIQTLYTAQVKLVSSVNINQMKTTFDSKFDVYPWWKLGRKLREAVNWKPLLIFTCKLEVWRNLC